MSNCRRLISPLPCRRHHVKLCRRLISPFPCRRHHAVVVVLLLLSSCCCHQAVAALMQLSVLFHCCCGPRAVAAWLLGRLSLLLLGSWVGLLLLLQFSLSQVVVAVCHDVAVAAVVCRSCLVLLLVVVVLFFFLLWLWFAAAPVVLVQRPWRVVTLGDERRCAVRSPHYDSEEMKPSRSYST
jgi:hypothetical protein